MQEKLESIMKFGFFLSASVGFFTLSRGIFQVLKQSRRFILSPKQNCFEKYGQTQTWALVTGGSDGIGLEISH